MDKLLQHSKYSLMVSFQDGSIQLQQTFANHSHMGSVRQVTIVNNLLVSGSSDEVIRIFDLNTRSEVGSIMEHQGTFIIELNVFEVCKFSMNSPNFPNYKRVKKGLHGSLYMNGSTLAASIAA